ncbi:hypothetical protein DV736_g5557, partial [Chaetothyriales sp. CBS 134916]
MPRRWLSRRGHQSNHPSSAHITPSDKPNPDFDFAFQRDLPASPPRAVPPSSGQLSTAQRPTTSNGFEARLRKKSHNDTPAFRPRTSDAHRAPFIPLCHRPTGSSSHDDLIGVAFGSPSHPPIAFRTLAAQMSPDSPYHALGHHGPLQDRQRRIFPRSWKKIGALFTAKHPTQKATEPPANSDQVPYQQLQASKSDELLPKHSWFKYKVQIQEPPTRHPPPPPGKDSQHEDDSIQKEVAERMPSSNGKTMLLDPTPFPSPYPGQESGKVDKRPTRSSTLPKLEISIPNQQLIIEDPRLKHAPAAPESSSLERRSKTLDSLRSGSSDSNIVSEPDDKPTSEKCADTNESDLLPATRSADPSLPKPEFHLKSSSSSPTLRKYSLFPPASPTLEKNVGKIQQGSPLKRSLTSPAQLSPMQSNFPTTKPRPLANSTKTLTEQDVASPVTNTASTEATGPWSAIPSKGSSLSSSNTDEIFFDVKSFRDSRGMEDGKHFVMSRPDSAVVELARTRSRLKSSASKEPANKTTPLANKEESSSVSSVNTAAFDDAIAMVEKLSLSQIGPELSQEAKSPPEENPPTIVPAAFPLPATSIGKTPITKRDLDVKLLPPDGVLPRPQSKGRTELPNTKFTVPSPIVEELSPGVAVSLAPENAMTSSKELSGPVLSRLRPRSQSPTQPQPKEMQQDSLPADAAAAAPVLTVSEMKPVPNSSTAPASQPASQSTKPYPPQARAIHRIDHPIQESPTIPQSPPLRLYSPAAAVALDQRAPPVPQKDAKYIPLSKYAARNTISKIELVGVRPARLDRAATDSFLSRTEQAAKSAKGMRVERSATIPAPRSSSSLWIQTGQAEGQERMGPQYHRQASSPGKAVVGIRTVGHGGLHTVTAVVQAAPTAEVSIARTVSLTRKQSSKVLVPGPKLAARRKQMAQHEEKQRREEGSSSRIKALAAVRVMVNSPQDSGHGNEKQAGEQHETENCGSIGKHSSLMSERTSTSTSTLTTISPNITAPALSRRALSNLKPLASHPMDSQVSLVSQASQVSQFSYQSEMSTLSKAQEKADRELFDKFKTKDKGQKEVQEGMRMSPVVVVEGLRGHKPGSSVGVVLDTA